MKLLQILVLIFVASQSQLLANDPKPGEVAQYYLAAHFVSGYWADNADEFRCPVLGEVTETKVAIFAKEAGPGTIRLAAALEQAVQKHPQLKRSFVLVSEENRDAPMTDSELTEKLVFLQAAGMQHGITKVSLGYLKYDTAQTRWRSKLGFFGTTDIIIAVIEPGIAQKEKLPTQQTRLPLRTVKPFYRYVARLNSTEMDETAATTAIADAISSLTK